MEPRDSILIPTGLSLVSTLIIISSELLSTTMVTDGDLKWPTTWQTTVWAPLNARRCHVCIVPFAAGMSKEK